MKGPLKIVLGVVTSICGFIEVGSLSTSAQAGAQFRFGLLWAVVIATIALIFMVEMSGRLAAISKHTLASAVRERFGVRYQAIPLGAEVVLDILVLASEIGGICIALQLLTGVSFRWWAVPVGLLIWALLWTANFSVIENGVGLLGIVTLVFVVAAWKLHPAGADLVSGLVPRMPDSDRARYGFLAVSILGATVSPYLINFYSSGAVEDHWAEKDVGTNRVVATLGMGFGSLVSIAVLVVAALVLAPRGILVEQYEQAAWMLTPVFRSWGVPLFAAALAVGCLGAALEVGLNLSYALSQGFGWNWGEDAKPFENARFATVYTVAVTAGSILMLAGIEPMKLTLFSMALSVLVLPFVVLPLLILMNDEHYVRGHPNGWISNLVVLIVVIVGAALALIAIPLEIAGGG